MNGLHNKSKVYFENADLYKIFSDAEDKPNLASEYLKYYVDGKVVLDAGCGNGKYLKEFKRCANKLIGIDFSKEQVDKVDLGESYFKLKYPYSKYFINSKVKVIASDLENISVEDGYFDLIYSNWVLGTIIDLDKRERVLEELKRVLKKNGKMLLVENDIGGEFEEIRGNYPNTLKTKSYNNWLESKGFIALKRIETYFEFKNEEEAKFVLNSIYKSRINKNFSRTINHKIVIYEYKKNY